MDPLSISMAILATIGAIKSSIKAAKSIYNAPEELEQLWNDLTEGEIMVLDIKHHLGQPKVEILPEANLQRRLREAESILLELKNLVQSTLSLPQDRTSAKRIKWFRTKKNILKLRTQLARIHQDLPRLLGVVETSRIKLELKNVSVIQQQMYTAQQGHMEILRSSQQLHQRVDSTVEEIRRDVLQRLERIESALPTNNGFQEVTVLPEFPIVAKRWPPDFSESTDTGAANEALHSNREPTTAPGLQSIYSSLRVQTQYRRPSSNQLSCHCPCRCHARQSVKTPSSLASLIGQMFVGYKGMPMMTKSCTVEGCRRNLGAQPTIHVVYYFPRWWIIDRMMLLIARQRSNLGPELIVQFPTYISWNTDAATFVYRGKIEALDREFANGMASPNDLITDGNIVTTCLLRRALRYRQFPMMKYLVHAGAAIDMEEINFGSVADEACRVLLIGDVPMEHQQWVKEVFLSNRLQDLEFSSLHENILGLRHTTVYEECSQVLLSGSSIDLQDLWGNTPLSWACARGNEEAVVQLLNFGANPNIANTNHQTPLSRALKSGSLECAIALLSHEVDATFVTNESSTAFQLAICFCGAHPSIALILDKLHGLGCDLNAKSGVGDSSFIHAIEGNHYTAIRWLLSHGGDYRNTARNGNILHWAAFHADPGMISILRKGELTGIDVHAKLEGRTVMDILLAPGRLRLATDELIGSFTRLLHEIEARTNARTPSSYANDKCSVAEPEPNTFFSEVKPSQIVEQISNPSAEDEEEEEQYFMDSLEVQADGLDEGDADTGN